MQHQQNTPRFATQTPLGSWRASPRPSLVTAPVRPASNFHAPGEEAWTQYDGLGPVGKDLSRNWRSGGPAGGSSNNSRPGPGVQNSAFIPSGPKASNHLRPPPQGPQQLKRNTRGPLKATGRDRSPQRGQQPQRGGGRGAERQRDLSQSGSSRASGPRYLIDEAYLQRNFEPLSKEDYKKAPDSLFTNPKGFLWDFKGIQAKSSFLSQKGGIFRCTVIVTLPNKQRVEAIGESMNKVRSNFLDGLVYPCRDADDAFRKTRRKTPASILFTSSMKMACSKISFTKEPTRLRLIRNY